MNPILAMLVGTSWKTSLSGLLIGLAVAGAAYAQTKSEPVWYLAGLGFIWLGRIAKDWDKSNAPTPVPEAAKVP